MEIKPLVQMEDLFRIDIRICKIVEAKRVPKKDKLIELKLEVSEGVFIPSVTNLGDKFQPEDFIGKFMPFVLNIPPSVRGGVKTEAMILAGEGKEINLLEGKELAIIW